MRFLLCALLALIACGSNNNGSNPDGPGGGDAPPGDAAVPPGCGAPDLSKPQCSNCIDDDSDGYIDSFDIECTGPSDNDEATFRTGIPGDNVDPVKQDCFFDGNSGSGNDGCEIHVCCLLGAKTVQECTIGQNQYDPASCPPPIGNNPLSQDCIDYCGALTPPGCDCFGCCTLCNPENPTECYDIATNPATSPNCTSDVLSDPTKCLRCEQVTSCGDPDCGGDTCILCPGQDPSDLPPSCDGSACPAGTTSCANGEMCPANTYCDASNQCCIGIVQ